MVTAVVLTVNVPLNFPARTVIVVGTVAAEFMDKRFTVAPLGPAGALRVTVAVEAAPPVTVRGLRVKEEIWAGLIVSVAIWG